MNTGILRCRWAAVGAALAITLGAGSVGILHATSPSGAATFVPITPCRVLDTRPASDNVGNRNTPIGGGESHTVTAHGNNGQCTGIPSGATGVSLNVTALNATTPTFLTVWPTGAPRPTASNLNPSPGAPPTPNAVTTGVSVDGRFDIFNAFGTVNVVIDINGYYIDHNHDDRYTRTEVVTVGGAPAGFVFPVAQLTLGTSTFTTTTAGYLHARLATSGGLNCATTTTFFGWLEVDGVPMPSSRVGIGENFGLGGDFTAANFGQKILEGVTSEPVPSGSHELRARFACTSGAITSSSAAGNAAGVVTVLAAAPTLSTTATAIASATATFDKVDVDASTMCILDATGSEVCAER